MWAKLVTLRFVEDVPIARLRYVKGEQGVEHRWRDRNLKLHLYDPVAPTPNVVIAA